MCIWPRPLEDSRWSRLADPAVCSNRVSALLRCLSQGIRIRRSVRTLAPSPRSSTPQAGLRQELKRAVGELCRNFPDTYWRELDSQRAYPEAFVQALTKAGYMATLIPEEYGGAGLGIVEAATILEEIHRSGGNAAACHAQMYVVGILLRHGSEIQKKKYLPALARGQLRLQAFGVSEPTTRSSTTQIQNLPRPLGLNS